MGLALPLYTHMEMDMVAQVAEAVQRTKNPAMNYSQPLQRQLKRLIDLLLSFIILIISSPLFLAIAILIRLDSPGPVFFRQPRPGKDGNLFKVWKFRSMVPNAEFMGARYAFVKDDPRVTRVGKILRSLSLDELPQLFNIINGEMSIVGPRPALLYQMERYNDFQRKRLIVKPGITGWAQIHGRNEIPWSQRFVLDAWYVDHWSLALDLKILCRTIPLVLRGRGVRMDQSLEEVEDF